LLRSGAGERMADEPMRGGRWAAFGSDCCTSPGARGPAYELVMRIPKCRPRRQGSHKAGDSEQHSPSAHANPRGGADAHTTLRKHDRGYRSKALTKPPLFPLPPCRGSVERFPRRPAGMVEFTDHIDAPLWLGTSAVAYQTIRRRGKKDRIAPPGRLSPKRGIPPPKMADSRFRLASLADLPGGINGYISNGGRIEYTHNFTGDQNICHCWRNCRTT
jgi:hypothetical protein